MVGFPSVAIAKEINARTCSANVSAEDPVKFAASIVIIFFPVLFYAAGRNKHAEMHNTHLAALAAA